MKKIYTLEEAKKLGDNMHYFGGFVTASALWLGLILLFIGYVLAISSPTN